jgi:hypothetical protein
MTERIGSPDNQPDPRDGGATQGQGKREGQVGQDAPASLQPRDAMALKSAIGPPPENDRAGDDKKPGVLQRGKAAGAVVAATVIVFSQSFTDLHPHHDLDERGHDRSEQTAKADRGTAADREADTCRVPHSQTIRPSAADRHVAEASAQVTAAQDDGSPAERLKKWIDEDGDEFLRAVAEDQEKRKEES